MANICFGCNDVEDIEKCSKVKCAHYGSRNEHLSMDIDANEKRTIIAKRASRDLAMYKPGCSRWV